VGSAAGGGCGLLDQVGYDLRCDLDRFAFLLGGNDGEHLLEPERDRN
jgi:hypothetical protein